MDLEVVHHVCTTPCLCPKVLSLRAHLVPPSPCISFGLQMEQKQAELKSNLWVKAAATERQDTHSSRLQFQQQLINMLPLTASRLNAQASAHVRTQNIGNQEGTSGEKPTWAIDFARKRKFSMWAPKQPLIVKPLVGLYL